MVEAPGTAPGSATLISHNVYRHSRSPDPFNIGLSERQGKGRRGRGKEAASNAQGKCGLCAFVDSILCPFIRLGITRSVYRGSTHIPPRMRLQMRRETARRYRKRSRYRWWNHLLKLVLAVAVLSALLMTLPIGITALKLTGINEKIILSIADAAATLIRKPFFVSRDCGFELIWSKRVPECRFLYVAENRGALLFGGIIRLPVIIFRADPKNPRPDPVLFIQGGPGGSNYTMPPMTATWIGSLDTLFWLGEHDFIVFDQRGSGSSEPSLECPGFDWLSPYISAEVTIEELLQPLLTCRERLVGEGVYLSNLHHGFHRGRHSGSSTTARRRIVESLGHVVRPAHCLGDYARPS